MSENEEDSEDIKASHRRKRRKIKGEEQDEDEEIKIKKRKKRSKTTKKDRGNENDNLEENEEKPKRKKKSRKKKEELEENEKDSNNEENEEKIKKKKRKKRKIQLTDDENESNVEENNSKPKKRKKRKKKKKLENEEENESNEEKEDEKSVKKSKSKKKNLLDSTATSENFFSKKEFKNEFYKTTKSIIKKKKKKRDNKDEENEDDSELQKTLPTLSSKLRSKKKKQKDPLSNKIESEQKDQEEENSDEDINDEENLNNFDKTDENWPTIKKQFLELIDNYFNEISLYEHIDIAIVSTICLSKKEYGNFKLTKHHEVYPIKNYNNINFAKEPYHKIQEKFYELCAPGKLLSKNNYLDFSNRVCNEYEIYTANVQLIKISGNNITEKVKPTDYIFLPKEKENINMKPHLFLFFSFNEEKSIMFYREVLEYLKENKDKFVFIPVYAPLIQAEKNVLFVTEMLYRYKVYEKGDEFEIYFCSNDALNKRFKYISEDNKKTITCKTVFLDVIDEKFVVRSIKDLDSFTFNLIDNRNEINKIKHKNIIKKLQKFKNDSKKQLKNTPLKEPFNCNLILKKAKIYTISHIERKLKLKYTLYDSLTGNLKCHNLYKSSEENFQKLCEILDKLGYYKLRLNPKDYRLNNSQINNLIIEEMNKCKNKNSELKNVKYKSIFQTQKIIMSLGSELNNEQKFEPMKSKSFKLEVYIDYKLFGELNPMNIIGSLYGLTLFSYFNNCDYIACLPKIGETFPNKLILTDYQTLKDVPLSLNDKPSLLVIFSLSFHNYFASSELNSRFKLITKKFNSFDKKDDINLILIYRGEPSKFKQKFEQIKDEPIFTLGSLFIQSSADMKFPLVYQNNDIESTDSQIMTYILNKNNKLIYTGNLEEIELDKTFKNLCEVESDDIDDIIEYKEFANLSYEDFKKMIKPMMNKIENIIEEEIKKKNSLLYRPFFSLSYNIYTNFENEETDNEKYVNHIRLRILVKEKHEDIFAENKEFKNIIAKLKKYGTSTIVTSIPCEELEFKEQCSNCKNNVSKINKNKPIYYDEESKQIFCEKCGEEFSKDIKNDTFLTFFNTDKYIDEVISEIYENHNKRNVSLNPVLGNMCKICQKKIGDCYYLNLTNFNIDYIESPLTPIDICENCFYEMRKGDPFLGEPKKRLNYERFGLNYKHMIYRKIFIPLIG